MKKAKDANMDKEIENNSEFNTFLLDNMVKIKEAFPKFTTSVEKYVLVNKDENYAFKPAFLNDGLTEGGKSRRKRRKSRKAKRSRRKTRKH